jgi:hypothetical protein
MLEVYPGGTEETGTVKWRFPSGPCNPPGPVTAHPTYFVLWFKRKPATPPLFH